MEGEEGEAPFVEEQVVFRIESMGFAQYGTTLGTGGCYSFAICECMARQVSDTDGWAGKHMTDDE